MQVLAQALEKCCGDAIRDVSKCSRAVTTVSPIWSNGHPGNRLAFEQEVHVGMQVPFEGSWSGTVTVVIPWIGIQRLWAESRLNTPLTPNDLTSAHIGWLTEIGEASLAQLLVNLNKRVGKESRTGRAKVAIDMPLVIVQTATIEAIRRKMGILPFSLKVSVADTLVEGVLLFSTRDSHLRQMKATGEVAA